MLPSFRNDDFAMSRAAWVISVLLAATSSAPVTAQRVPSPRFAVVQSPGLAPTRVRVRVAGDERGFRDTGATVAAGALLMGGAGLLAGGGLGYLALGGSNLSCGDDTCGLLGALFGAALGESVGVGLGGYLGGRRHGSFARDILAPVAVGAAAFAPMIQGKIPWIAVPIAQVVSVVIVDRQAAAGAARESRSTIAAPRRLSP